MKLGLLIEMVVDAIQDTSFSESLIKGLINDAAIIMADAARLPALSVGMNSVDTATGAFQVSMPADYHKLTFRCMDGARQVNIRNNMEEFLMLYNGDMTNEGDVENIVIQGSTLFYQPVPATSASLMLFYSKLPPALVKSSDIPSFLPSPKNHKGLANYAIGEIFNIIEDGIEGEKVNTMTYEKRFANDTRQMVDSILGRKTKKGPQE